MTYKFNVTADTANFEIRIDLAAGYGYFEHNELGDGCGGGLWFGQQGDDSLTLSDYDGVAILPQEVGEALRAAGFAVGDECLPDIVYHVTLHMLNREYGGAEEGGWWYDTGEPCESEHNAKFHTNALAYEHCARLNEDGVLADLNEGRAPLSSVMSDGVFRFLVTTGKAKPYPATRPHYE